MRRLHVFHTRSLIEKSVEAPAWMEKNAFNVLLWIVKELSQNSTYVDKEDLFFERAIDERVPIMVRYHLQFFWHVNMQSRECDPL